MLCVCALQCVLPRVVQLTSDNDGDLRLSAPNAVADLTDKSCVDSVIHLQNLQLPVVAYHCAWQISRHTARLQKYRREKEIMTVRKLKNINSKLFITNLDQQCKPSFPAPFKTQSIIANCKKSQWGPF